MKQGKVEINGQNYEVVVIETVADWGEPVTDEAGFYAYDASEYDFESEMPATHAAAQSLNPVAIKAILTKKSS